MFVAACTPAGYPSVMASLISSLSLLISNCLNLSVSISLDSKLFLSICVHVENTFMIHGSQPTVPSKGRMIFLVAAPQGPRSPFLPAGKMVLPRPSPLSSSLPLGRRDGGSLPAPHFSFPLPLSPPSPRFVSFREIHRFCAISVSAPSRPAPPGEPTTTPLRVQAGGPQPTEPPPQSHHHRVGGGEDPRFPAHGREDPRFARRVGATPSLSSPSPGSSPPWDSGSFGLALWVGVRPPSFPSAWVRLFVLLDLFGPISKVNSLLLIVLHKLLCSFCWSRSLSDDFRYKISLSIVFARKFQCFFHSWFFSKNENMISKISKSF